MSRETFQQINKEKTIIPPEFKKQVDDLCSQAIENAKGFIEATEESQANKEMAIKKLSDSEFVEWAREIGRQMLTSKNDSDQAMGELARKIASNALRGEKIEQ